MIDFISKANEVLSASVANDKWSVYKFAEATETSLPHLLQYLNEALDKEVDLSSTLSLCDLNEALENLRKNYKVQLEEFQKKKERTQKKSLKAFDILMMKIRKFQVEKNWIHAYKTLCYFTGQHAEDLPKEYATTLYSELIRMGIRAEINIQELSRWLQKGVAIAMSYQSQDGVAEALDFMDAYGEYFLSEKSGKGTLLFGSILSAIEEPAARYELWEEYKELVNKLFSTEK